MIRDAIARHSGASVRARAVGVVDEEAGVTLRAHSSHGLFAVVPAGDGECIIEPSVRCDHCGYCRVARALTGAPTKRTNARTHENAETPQRTDAKTSNTLR